MIVEVRGEGGGVRAGPCITLSSICAIVSYMLALNLATHNGYRLAENDWLGNGNGNGRNPNALHALREVFLRGLCGHFSEQQLRHLGGHLPIDPGGECIDRVQRTWGTNLSRSKLRPKVLPVNFDCERMLQTESGMTRGPFGKAPHKMHEKNLTGMVRCWSPNGCGYE